MIKDESLNFIQDSILKQLQKLIIFFCIEKDSKSLREWKKNLPKRLKFLSKIKKSQSKEFQELLFESDYFHQKKK